MTGPAPGDRRPENLARAAAQVTAGNVVSRVTGLVRVVAVAAALGTTFLGNTFQTANLVSNILFELLAAGLLSSVLIPPFVRLLDAGRDDEAGETAGALLGVGLVALGVVVLVGILARTWIMRALTVEVADAGVRAQEVRLGSFLLILFLPQVLLYAIGAVATALLNGARRFAAPAFAPVANNIVVTATMGLFWAMRHASGSSSGAPPLTLPMSQRLVLAVGTTAGVVAMTLVPLVAVWRQGLRLRPHWDLAHAGLRAMGRAGLWAAGYLALAQALVATTLVLANRVEGGVVAYHIAFTVFLLPHAVLAHPTMTTLYPTLAAEAAARRWRSFADRLTAGAGTLVFLLAPATAVLVALAHPLVSLLRLGNLNAAGAGLVARVLAAYALGLGGYAGFQLLTRASYALDDTRTPTLVNAVVAAAGSGLMVLLFALAAGDDRVVVVGLAHSLVMTGASVAVLATLRRRLGRWCVPLAGLLRASVCALAAGGLARVLADALPSGGRSGAALTLVVAGGGATLVYLAGQWGLGAPELRTLWARHRLSTAVPGASAPQDSAPQDSAPQDSAPPDRSTVP
jgi:putative peptidoglycan lipid II flippase